MKIKTKLTLGVGLLFAMIVLLTVLSTISINQLSSDAKNILTDNYNSIDYSRKMIEALNSGIDKVEGQQKFRDNLSKQQNTITEIGEKELTEKVVADYKQIQKAPLDNHLRQIVQKDLTDIMLLNMQAIQRKSEVAIQTSDSAILWISISGTICFLIAFTLLINLPSNIANPIKELTESIKQIAAEKYSERVHFESHSEFGELAKSFNTMAQKLEEYNNSNLAKLMMEKRRIETLINNMNDPVIGLDEHQNILFINSEALKISGLKQGEVVGQAAQKIAIHNDLMRSLIQDIPNSSVSQNKPMKPLKIFADNKESFFEKSIVPINIIPTAEKQEIHIGDVIMLQNITSFKELDLAKTNFIATVSHEFKTPISSIKMSLQLLENEEIGKLNEEQKNLIAGIKDDATRLLKITGELLNMTQAESGNIQLSILPSDPKEIIQYAVNATKTQAEQKQIKFEINCPNTISKVQADNEKTAWVLINLISNAIRYSYEGTIIYLVIVEQNNSIQISVKDKGQGIEPQYKGKIFDRYFQVPGYKKEGTGLGLAISKEFIEAQGGYITVDSEYGVGSTFTIILNKA